MVTVATLPETEQAPLGAHVQAERTLLPIGVAVTVMTFP
jgi:hypothetical protein